VVATDRGTASVMTEEHARSQAETLAIGMGITFYVVRSAEREFMPVQLLPDDCEILATITPPTSGNEPTLQ
jgi:hypothetical protein